MSRAKAHFIREAFGLVPTKETAPMTSPDVPATDPAPLAWSKTAVLSESAPGGGTVWSERETTLFYGEPNRPPYCRATPAACTWLGCPTHTEVDR